MKFLCIPCDKPLKLQEVGDPGAGSFSLAYRCPSCGHQIAMLTNAGETQLVQSLGVHLGGGDGSAQPLSALRSSLQRVRPEALAEDDGPEPTWNEAAEARLAQHPRYVQPVIRKTCTDYARKRGLRQITPEMMDAVQRAPSES